MPSERILFVTVRFPTTLLAVPCSMSSYKFSYKFLYLQLVFGKIHCFAERKKVLHVVQTSNIKMLYIQLLCSKQLGVLRRNFGVIFNMWMLEYTTFKCWTYISFQYHGVVCPTSVTQNKLRSYTTYGCWNIQL